MKKLVLFLMLLLPFVLFGQDLPTPPDDFSGFIVWFKVAFGTWAGALVAILVVIEKLKRVFSLKGKGAVILSWGISIPISAIAFYFQFGIFAEIEWYVAAIYAASFTLAANLAYLVPFIKEVTRIVIDWISKEKKAKLNT